LIDQGHLFVSEAHYGEELSFLVEIWYSWWSWQLKNFDKEWSKKNFHNFTSR